MWKVSLDGMSNADQLFMGATVPVKASKSVCPSSVCLSATAAGAAAESMLAKIRNWHMKVCHHHRHAFVHKIFPRAGKGLLTICSA